MPRGVQMQVTSMAGMLPSAGPESAAGPAIDNHGKTSKKPRERWTQEEHDRFVEGLRQYHRDWRAIESAQSQTCTLLCC